MKPNPQKHFLGGAWCFSTLNKSILCQKTLYKRIKNDTVRRVPYSSSPQNYFLKNFPTPLLIKTTPQIYFSTSLRWQKDRKKTNNYLFFFFKSECSHAAILFGMSNQHYKLLQEMWSNVSKIPSNQNRAKSALVKWERGWGSVLPTKYFVFAGKIWVDSYRRFHISVVEIYFTSHYLDHKPIMWIELEYNSERL